MCFLFPLSDADSAARMGIPKKNENLGLRPACLAVGYPLRSIHVTASGYRQSRERNSLDSVPVTNWTIRRDGCHPSNRWPQTRCRKMGPQVAQNSKRQSCFGLCHDLSWRHIGLGWTGDNHLALDVAKVA